MAKAWTLETMPPGRVKGVETVEPRATAAEEP
jgi:hypothetical protein